MAKLSSINKKYWSLETLRCVQTFAKENGLLAYLPGQAGFYRLLTNRDGFAPSLKAFYGKRTAFEVRVTESYTVDEIFLMQPIE